MGNVPFNPRKPALHHSCLRSFPHDTSSCVGNTSSKNDATLLSELYSDDRSGVTERMQRVEAQLDFISRQIEELSAQYEDEKHPYAFVQHPAKRAFFSSGTSHDSKMREVASQTGSSSPQTSTPMQYHTQNSSWFSERLKRETDEMLGPHILNPVGRNSLATRSPVTWKVPHKGSVYASLRQQYPSIAPTFTYRPNSNLGRDYRATITYKPASHHHTSPTPPAPSYVRLSPSSNSALNYQSKDEGKDQKETPRNEVEQEGDYERTNIKKLIHEFENQSEEHSKKQAILHGFLEMEMRGVRRENSWGDGATMMSHKSVETDHSESMNKCGCCREITTVESSVEKPQNKVTSTETVEEAERVWKLAMGGTLEELEGALNPTYPLPPFPSHEAEVVESVKEDEDVSEI
ncbi:hypothetical protein CAPTEDRAFT_203268 [Capitella teleta]|uniref:Uncharacterized protein n=1 Tax=Capitella teleta TaxID=283909 RepID=R7TSN9_CAPTE|nr:hypothetical protein CAPTEDRAFT_203268 [Capitella teleta]|eukprot:ELT96898.1 hypothetical protein CAPTEDRAFT_203268 [Capitella teleta]